MSGTELTYHYTDNDFSPSMLGSTYGMYGAGAYDKTVPWQWFTSEDVIVFMYSSEVGGMAGETIRNSAMAIAMQNAIRNDNRPTEAPEPSNSGNVTGPVKPGNLVGELDGLTSAEKSVVDDLLAQGKNVEIVPRSNVPGVKTPDFKINGVLTELKTLNGTSLNTPVSKIQNAFKQSAESVIIDGRNVGLTGEQANTVLNRIQGIYTDGVPGGIEIWAGDGIITLP